MEGVPRGKLDVVVTVTQTSSSLAIYRDSSVLQRHECIHQGPEQC